MIIVIAQFRLPQPLTRDQARDKFLGTAPRYKDMPGLIRKHYLLSDDGSTVGGVYLWESREHAQRLYTDEWSAFVRKTYGSEPSVAYYESPVIVDNLRHDIIAE